MPTHLATQAEIDQFFRGQLKGETTDGDQPVSFTFNTLAICEAYGEPINPRNAQKLYAKHGDEIRATAIRLWRAGKRCPDGTVQLDIDDFPWGEGTF